MKTTSDELRKALGIVARLRQFDEADAATIRSGGRWSRKQILGHLIDSAANNHQRFVRLQQSSLLDQEGYQQEVWVAAQRYDERPWSELVDLWLAYNTHLAHVIERLDPAALNNRWNSPEGPLTLEFIAQDYLRHLDHHLSQIFEH